MILQAEFLTLSALESYVVGSSHPSSTHRYSRVNGDSLLKNRERYTRTAKRLRDMAAPMCLSKYVGSWQAGDSCIVAGRASTNEEARIERR